MQPLDETIIVLILGNERLIQGYGAGCDQGIRDQQAIAQPVLT